MRENKNKSTYLKAQAVLRLTNTLLSQSNRYLLLQSALSSLKSNQKTQTLQLNQSSLQDNQSKNKSLYFQYVAQVLQKKEEQLLIWQKQLETKEQEFNQKCLAQEMMTKIKLIEEIKNSEMKLKNLGALVVAEERMDKKLYLEEYTKLASHVETQCNKFKEDMEEEFREFYEEITAERMILRKKLAQFAQLTAYEKYLNELHDALELRNEQLTHSEESLRNIALPQRSQSICNASQQSNKKRHRIFDRKNNKTKQQSGNSQQIFWQQNQTFANQEEKNYLKNQIQSQPIEESTQKDSLPSQMQEGTQRREIVLYEKFAQTEHYFNYPCLRPPSQYDMISRGIQFSSNTDLQAIQKMENQRKICKFLKLWFKFSFKKGHVSWQKIFAVYLWRINSIFDEQIPEKCKIALGEMDALWGKQKNKLIKERVFPIQGMPIKKTKYSEMFLEHSFKKQHRQNIQKTLVSILRNRNRKERLTFYFYFIRFYKNAMNAGVPSCRAPLEISERSALMTPGYSKILQEQHITTPLSRKKQTPKKSVTPSKASSRNLSKKLSTHTVKPLQNKCHSKQNKPISSTCQSKQQISKLKNYIEQKQRIQRLLATQCVKMQGLIKMSLTLASIGNRTNYELFNILAKKQFSDRIESLSSQITSLQFRLELILTKCRLGLANNNNKLTTLQNLLGFTNFIK